MHAVATTLAVLALSGPFPHDGSDHPANSILDDCIVTPVHDVLAPAEAPGRIVAFSAVEGEELKTNQLIARLEDTEPRLEQQLAITELEAAQEQAASDVHVRAARASASVAQAEYEQAVWANDRVPETYAVTEVRRLKLAWHRSYLEIEQAQLEHRIAQLTVNTRDAQMQAAEHRIRQRQVLSPLDGQVVERFKQVGEWVNPGDPLLRIIRLEILRIEGFIDAAEHDPSDILGRPVAAVVRLARGRTVKLEGSLDYASPLVQAGGQYQVWATVSNVRKNGHWLVRPGLSAEMTIKLQAR